MPSIDCPGGIRNKKASAANRSREPLKLAEGQGGSDFNLPKNSYPQLIENSPSQSLHQSPRRLADATHASVSLTRHKQFKIYEELHRDVPVLS